MNPVRRFVPHGNAIRVPVTRVKGLTNRTADAMVQARQRGGFTALSDFFHRVAPAAEELETMIRAGGFDEFGETRTRQFWQAQHLVKTYSSHTEPNQGWLIAPPGLEQLVSIPLTEPMLDEEFEAVIDYSGRSPEPARLLQELNSEIKREAELRDKSDVKRRHIGDLSPDDVGRVLAWLAKERRDLQEQAEWREQIPALLEKMKNEQGDRDDDSNAGPLSQPPRRK